MERSLPRRLYDASWGRAFALDYDWFLSSSEKAGLRRRTFEVDWNGADFLDLEDFIQR